MKRSFETGSTLLTNQGWSLFFVILTLEPKGIGKYYLMYFWEGTWLPSAIVILPCALIALGQTDHSGGSEDIQLGWGQSTIATNSWLHKNFKNKSLEFRAQFLRQKPVKKGC